MSTALHIVFSVMWYFYVTMVTFPMPLLMNEFTSIVIPSYFQFIQMRISETKFGIYCIPEVFVMKCCHVMSWVRIKLDENHSVSGSICDLVNSLCPNLFTRHDK